MKYFIYIFSLLFFFEQSLYSENNRSIDKEIKRLKYEDKNIEDFIKTNVIEKSKNKEIQINFNNYFGSFVIKLQF